jgi:alpha-tubulin suppressor-like RCC1 family protein
LVCGLIAGCASCAPGKKTADAGKHVEQPGLDAASVNNVDAAAKPPPTDASQPTDAKPPPDARTAEDAQNMSVPADDAGDNTPGAIVSLAAGAAHACAITDSGTVYGWGRNTHGELANLQDTAVLEPQRLALGLRFTGMRAGGASKDTGHTCALSDGAVYCWGANDYGQLGDGTRNASHQPVRALGLSDAIALDLGGSHTCALRSSGQMMCWGRGDSGQLGTGKLNDELQPADVVSLSGANSLSVGTYHGCATRAQDVVCWGANAYGELGRGDRLLSATPVAVQGLGAVRAIEAGGFATCAILLDGHVSCWGSNEYGQLGTANGGTGNVSTAPVAVKGLDEVAQISLGGSHSCARSQGGVAWCWGGNALGQLGDGTQAGHDVPALVPGLEAVQRIEAASGFTLVLDAHAGPVAFGANDTGQLGDGTRTARTRPVSIHLQ